MAIRIRDKNRVPQALARIGEINAKKVEVGYFGAHYSGGKITNTGLAAVHEYGANIAVTPKQRAYLAAALGVYLKASTTHIRIPERSFLRTGSQQAIPTVVAKAKQFVPLAIAGNVDVDLLYEMLGLEMKGEIQEYAIDLSSPPNSSLTIAQKGSSNPLVDTGGMIAAMEVRVT